MRIGVVLLVEDGQADHLRYHEIRQLALQAEANGLDSIWLYDHLLFRAEGEPPQGHWECFTIASALAEATTRVTIGTMVAAVPFRNPALLAKMATALDEVSNGRFVLGIGTGWNEAEFTAFGYPYDHRVDRFEEAVKIIQPLLHDGHVDFSGTYYQAVDCLDIPRGPSPHGTPLLLGAFGPRMLDLAVRYGDSINTDRWSELDALCQSHGRDPATLERTTMLWVALPELGLIPPHMRDATYRTADAIAARLTELEQIGAQHVIVDLRPKTSAALMLLTEAMNRYRANS